MAEQHKPKSSKPSTDDKVCPSTPSKFSSLHALTQASLNQPSKTSGVTGDDIGAIRSKHSSAKDSVK